MKKTAAVWFAAYSLFSASCQRPFARYQPMPVERFSSPPKTQILTPSSVEEPLPQPEEWPALPAGPEAVARPEFYASTKPNVPTRSQRPVSSSRITQALTAPAMLPNEQPRPRPKARNGEKKTLREILGLKPRRKLNWWQRIHWSLKAAVPVILVAVVFALLKINILAIIFGLLGAFLLIRGLKKEFKVRRPLF